MTKPLLRTYHVNVALPNEEVDALKSQFVNRYYYDFLISGESWRVTRPDGSTLLWYLHDILPSDVCTGAFRALMRAARTSFNRGTAAGSGFRRIVKRDGTLSNTLTADPVSSGLLGTYDRTPRFPFCRTTAYTAEEMRGWRTVLPFIAKVSDIFRKWCPDRFAIAMDVARRTHPHWVIGGTPFTTGTVNWNWRTHVHKDEGDLEESFGVMSVMQRGSYEGCHLVFPKYRVAVEMRERGVLLADVHEWHGNTELIGLPNRFSRLSTVWYYRTNMIRCGSPEEELRRAQNRRPGQPLY